MADVAPAPASPPFERKEPAAINFRNGLAVKVAITAAALAFLMLTVTAFLGASFLQLLLPMVISAGSGFLAVFLYRRRSGEQVSVRDGARIGWITGVFAFVMTIVMFTLGVAAAVSQGGFVEVYRQSADRVGIPQDTVEQVTRLLENPVTVAVSLLFLLAMQFMMQTLMSSAGGAIGAKFLARER